MHWPQSQQTREPSYTQNGRDRHCATRPPADGFWSFFFFFRLLLLFSLQLNRERERTTEPMGMKEELFSFKVTFTEHLLFVA
jgi:hypothetical protein